MPIDIEALEAEQKAAEIAAAAKPAGTPPDRGDEVVAATTTELPKADDTKVADDAATAATKADADAKAVEAKKDTLVDDKKAVEATRDPETGKFIPKSRFDEQTAKLRKQISDRDETIAKQRTELEARGTKDIETLEAAMGPKMEEYGQLLADGKLKEAKVVMADINKLNRQIARLEMEPTTHAQTAVIAQAATVDELISYYTGEFPVLDDTSPNFNKELVNEISLLQGDFERAGNYSRAAAFQRAMELVIPKHGLVAKSDAVAAPAAAAVKAKTPAEERKTSAVELAVKAANAQPAALANVGSDSDSKGLQKIVMADLPYGEFVKLPEETLKRIRGDSL